ncbi:ATP-binding protein [uncultured Dechloromonas sp.]|uniref:HAMP domain-containing sensor histidine kinase n=1 Tax=uncultured Dechloromonas sp. TaxID=171719 RepID=UPI0025CD217E|nr:ATP-binding protein [uncultured Dechloromonas sp.]
MGRLFWKLFLFIWLGQVLAVLGTGALFWAERRGFVGTAEQAMRPPPPPPPGTMRERGEGPPSRFAEGFAHDEPPPPPPPRRAPGHSGIHLPFWPLFAGFFASLLCAGGLAWYFAKPIRHLRRGFKAVSGGDLTTRVSPGMGRRRDELADLGQDFDRMAERMEGVLEGQRRLLHDVSHELRSPLARLQAAIGLARQQPERSGDSMSRIERESERMNRLIGELLTLSRLEAGCTLELGSVDMDELMAGVVEDARFEGMARALTIAYVPGEMACVRGNAEMLHRAIENVVRNALRFSPPGDVVRIEAGLVEAGRFMITVLDRGPGVDAEDMASIFTPFFRGKGEANGDGYGLGLAIARQVVLASGGEIEAANGKESGFRISISIPSSSD